VKNSNTFNYNNSKELPLFSRNSITSYFEPVRKKILKATPEEEVRIKFIDYLLTQLEVPEDMLRTEIQMSKIKKGARGRADIMGLYYDTRREEKRPLFIVECKAPIVELIDRTFEQALGYAKNASTVTTIILTNGIETIFYIKKNGEFIRVNNIITYSKMLKINNINWDYTSKPHLDFVRPEIGKFNDSKMGKEYLAKHGSIGQGTPKEHYKYLFNIIGLFKYYHSSLSFPLKSDNFTIIEDGYRFTSFGNAAGGVWPGDYRYFLLDDNNKQNQVVSIAFLPQVYKNENPRFPNGNGHTIMIIAIDDFDKNHNSLQLDMDESIIINGENIEILHNGKLTAGSKGAISPHIVIDFISRKRPNLIKNGKIYLGTLPYNRLITWNDAKEFLINCIDYALLRDEIRKENS